MMKPVIPHPEPGRTPAITAPKSPRPPPWIAIGNRSNCAGGSTSLPPGVTRPAISGRCRWAGAARQVGAQSAFNRRTLACVEGGARTCCSGDPSGPSLGRRRSPFAPLGTPLALSWVLLAYAAVAVAAGSAFSFSTSIAVTQWSLAQGSGGALGSPAAGARTAGWLLLAFGRRGVVPARRSVRVAIAAVLALAVLGLGAGMPWTSRPATVRCCTAALFNRRLLAVAVAAIALGTLIIRQLTALFQHELEQHASRSRHDLAEAHARLHHIATHDPLTGLPNRNLFKERLAKSFADKRHSGRAIAVAAMDLDRFSTINHSLGHGVGDGVLM